jgi:hypothetical protein
MSLVPREKHEVISVPDIVLLFEYMFHIQVKLVHVHIHEELGGKVAKWETLSFLGTMKAFDNTLEKPKCTSIKLILC